MIAGRKRKADELMAGSPSPGVSTDDKSGDPGEEAATPTPPSGSPTSASHVSGRELTLQEQFDLKVLAAAPQVQGYRRDARGRRGALYVGHFAGPTAASSASSSSSSSNADAANAAGVSDTYIDALADAMMAPMPMPGPAKRQRRSSPGKEGREGKAEEEDDDGAAFNFLGLSSGSGAGAIATAEAAPAVPPAGISKPSEPAAKAPPPPPRLSKPDLRAGPVAGAAIASDDAEAPPLPVPQERRRPPPPPPRNNSSAVAEKREEEGAVAAPATAPDEPALSEA